MKIFTRTVLLVFILGALHSAAQDIHFSMFYASPLNLNPALTGVSEGTYRAAGIYRNQWRSISTPYTTYSASFDIKLLQGLLKNDVFGVGAMFVGDKAGDGKLATNSAMLSASFHKGLDKNHKHFIGLGLQFGYTQKSLQYQQLTFPSQFYVNDFDLNISNGENLGKAKVGYFDMQAGILQQSSFGKDNLISFMTGFTVYHLVQPKESFLGQKVLLAPRYTVHEGIRIRATKNFYITPNFIYQYQNKNQEANIGTGFEYHMNLAKSEAVVSLGGWVRATNIDAAIISMGVEYYRVRLLAAYDINTSSLQAATNNRGAFELAIIFTGLLKSKAITAPVMVPCPMM